MSENKRRPVNSGDSPTMYIKINKTNIKVKCTFVVVSCQCVFLIYKFSFFFVNINNWINVIIILHRNTH